MIVDDDIELLNDIKAPAANGRITPASLLPLRRLTLSGLLRALRHRPEDLPHLIFLDLKFYSESEGIGALRWLKSNKKRGIRMIPVIIYSNSTESWEIERCYAKGANEYVPKGADQIGQFWKAVAYWAETSRSPIPSSDSQLQSRWR